MKVTIEGREWEFHYSFGALYDFENALEKVTFDASKTLHRHVMYFAMLQRCNKDWEMSAEAFFELLDRCPGLAAFLDKCFFEDLERRGRKAAEEMRALEEAGGEQKKST